jgi:predicted DNA-binding transcriptional regulator AlpA
MNDKIPPWIDMEMLSWAICASPSSIENYVAQGKLPPPRRLGGKRLWKWSEVEARLTNGDSVPKLGGLADAVRRDIAASGTR